MLQIFGTNASDNLAKHSLATCRNPPSFVAARTRVVVAVAVLSQSPLCRRVLPKSSHDWFLCRTFRAVALFSLGRFRPSFNAGEGIWLTPRLGVDIPVRDMSNEIFVPT